MYRCRFWDGTEKGTYSHPFHLSCPRAVTIDALMGNKNNNSSSSNAPNKGDIQVRTDNAQFSMAGTLKSLFASYTLLLLLCFYCTPILMIRGRRRTEEDSSAEWGMRSSPEFLNGVVGGSGLVSSLPAMHCILFRHNHHNHQIATRVRK